MKELAAPVASRLSWEDAHRLEVRLRARATQLSATGNCPGCGCPVSATDQHIRLAGLTVHCGCLSRCGDTA